MIIPYVCGGLGNQMFQYATARRLAHVTKAELKLDLSGYQKTGSDERPAGLEEFRREIGLYKLSVTAPAASPQEIARLRDPYSKRTTVARIVRRIRRLKKGFLWPATHFREKQYRFDPAVLDLPGDVYLDGFWQSPKYFDDIRPILLREFMPKDPAIVPYARQYVDQLKSAGATVVSLHVRRGDLARAQELKQELKQANLVHAEPMSMEYYSKAMARFGPECHFLVFSDSAQDIQWCRDNIPGQRLHFSEGHSDIQDLTLMMACDSHIIANSTFSWWAAWLDDKPSVRVIAPKVWSLPNAKFRMVPDDLVPQPWEQL